MFADDWRLQPCKWASCRSFSSSAHSCHRRVANARAPLLECLAWLLRCCFRLRRMCLWTRNLMNSLRRMFTRKLPVEGLRAGPAYSCLSRRRERCLCSLGLSSEWRERVFGTAPASWSFYVRAPMLSGIADTGVERGRQQQLEKIRFL